MTDTPNTGLTPEQEAGLRAHIVGMIRLMGFIVVPAALYERARELLPEVADKIVKSERLPTDPRARGRGRRGGEGCHPRCSGAYASCHAQAEGTERADVARHG
jgi:hypothetical protein